MTRIASLWTWIGRICFGRKPPEPTVVYLPGPQGAWRVTAHSSSAVTLDIEAIPSPYVMSFTSLEDFEGEWRGPSYFEGQKPS